MEQAQQCTTVDEEASSWVVDSLFSDQVVEVVDRRAKVRQVLHRGKAPAHFERKVKRSGRRHFRYMLQWHTSSRSTSRSTRGFGSDTSPRRREHVDKMD